MAEKCDAEFIGDDAPFTCDRDGRHIVHQDAVGTKAIRVPGGALISKPRQN